MMIDLIREIKKQIRLQKTAIASEMVEGRMSDFQSYSKNVGIAEGLEQACSLIDETMKKMNQEDV